jgi:hypothetical protein
LRRRRLGIDPAPAPAASRYQVRAVVAGVVHLGGYRATAAGAREAARELRDRLGAGSRRGKSPRGRGAYYRGPGRWEGKFVAGGVTVRVGTFGTEEEAAAAVAAKRGEVA